MSALSEQTTGSHEQLETANVKEDKQSSEGTAIYENRFNEIGKISQLQYYYFVQ